jgi:hypothetical protein
MPQYSATAAVSTVSAATGQILLPVIRFGGGLQLEIPFLEKAPHVSGKKEPLGEPTERPKRRGEVEDVAHRRPGGRGTEVVIMRESPERASHHLVPKMAWPIEGADAHG